jgi:hypothetical protein
MRGHDPYTSEGQQTLARQMVAGAQEGAAMANLQEVRRRHRQKPGAQPPRCITCWEPWVQASAAVEGCSTILLADSLEAMLHLVMNRPPAGGTT